LTEHGDGTKKDETRAHDLYASSCAKMEGTGCTFLGHATFHSDPAKSAPLYEKGCQLGHDSGCTYLGILLDEGRGITKDTAKALTLWEKACLDEEATACFHLATALPQTDKARRLELARKSCRGLDEDGCKLWKSLGGTGDP
jgi:TPR repeat protein